MNTISRKVEVEDAGRIYTQFLKMGMEVKNDSNPYLEWKLVGNGVTAMLYTSGKLVVQGNVDLGYISEVLDGKSSNEVSVFEAHVGADEVGKGDYFGPMVVCACFVPEDSYNKVMSLGVNDSKKLSDGRIHTLYEDIKDVVNYRVEIIEPTQFNSEYEKFMNISKLLANIHALNIRELIVMLDEKSIKYNRVVIDQFSANKGRLESVLKGINFVQMHRAEAQDIPTAVASIIARRYFLVAMDQMSSLYGIDFPKGATDVIRVGREFVQRYGVDRLGEVAKLSFKTTQSVLI